MSSISDQWFSSWTTIKQKGKGWLNHKFAKDLADDLLEQIDLMTHYINLEKDESQVEFLRQREREHAEACKIVTLAVVLYYIRKFAYEDLNNKQENQFKQDVIYA